MLNEEVVKRPGETSFNYFKYVEVNKSSLTWGVIESALVFAVYIFGSST